MRKIRAKTKASQIKINNLFLLLSSKGELSFKEIKKELGISCSDFSSLLCIATDIMPIYETDDKKIGLLK